MLTLASILCAALIAASAPRMSTPIPSEVKVSPARAVESGLLWLARHQNPNGSWSVGTLKERCTPMHCCADSNPALGFNDHYDQGLTGLALLAFLRAGYSDEAKKEISDKITSTRISPGAVITKGLAWLQSRQTKLGQFRPDRGFLYDEVLATMAMIEASRVSKNPLWRESAQRGIAWLEAAQRSGPSDNGLWGWRYESRQEIEAQRATKTQEEIEKLLRDSDLSTTGWAVAALASARDAKLTVRMAAFDGALAFCKFVSVNDGTAGYTDVANAGAKVTGPGDEFDYHTSTMSALSLAIQLECQDDRKLPFLERAAQRLMNDLPRVTDNKLSIDYYNWYHGSLALNLYDGRESRTPKKKYSGAWNAALIAALIPLQDRAESGCSHGGWLVPDRWSQSGGPIYSTAFGVLALEACVGN